MQFFFWGRMAVFLFWGTCRICRTKSFTSNLSLRFLAASYSCQLWRGRRFGLAARSSRQLSRSRRFGGGDYFWVRICTDLYGLKGDHFTRMSNDALQWEKNFYTAARKKDGRNGLISPLLPYFSVLLRTSPYFSDIAATFREHRKKSIFYWKCTWKSWL